MAIFNKDGTPFRLRGVNPLMKDQDRWGEFVVHGFEGLGAAEEVQSVPPKPAPESKPVVAVSAGVVVHCLPAVVRVVEDPLYGQTRRVGYGERFSFEAVPGVCTGVTAVFRARRSPGMPEIAPGSILYVFKERAWWKADSISAGDEFEIYCVPSDLKPSFA